MTEKRIYYSHDAELQARRATTITTLLRLILGVSIGAVVALLFAPSSGKKTRADLAKTVEEGLNTGRDAVEPLVKRMEDEIGDLRKKVEETITNPK
jgi:gas vesicle protein